jgi:acetylornithine deacetylase/succinyl-diaminopimelate desuccinylase-like protein
VAVPGLRREEWTGASYSEDEFRELAEIEPGMPFFGTGSLGERLWSGPGDTGKGFAARTSGSAYDAARAALTTAWGSEPQLVVTGGAIPLVSALQEAVPAAEVLLLGTTDGFANIHAPNERVLLGRPRQPRHADPP